MNINKIFSNTVSVSDLQRNYAFFLKKLSSKKEPLFILKNNELKAVLIPPNLFEEYSKRMQEFEERDTDEAIKIYKKEKKEGKLKILKNLEDLFE